MDACCRLKYSDVSPVDTPLHKLLCCMMPASTSIQNIRQHHQGSIQSDQGLLKLLGSLDQLRSKVKGQDTDLDFLMEFFNTTQTQSLLKLHGKISDPELASDSVDNVLQLAEEVCDELDLKSTAPEVKELCNILAKPHLKAFLRVHDQVSKRDFLPTLPDIPYEVDEDDDCLVKIVRIVKASPGPLGATMKLNEKTRKLHIARILHGGAAERSGLIHVGDQVKEVNGVPVTGKQPNEVVNILTEAIGCITISLVPGDDSDIVPSDYKECKIRVRARFDYDPTDDKLAPCQEAGLAFKKGDILHIVSQDDGQWWQARKEGDRNLRAGIIPSRRQMESKFQALKLERKIHGSPKHAKGCRSPIKFSPKLNKKSKRTKKLICDHAMYDDFDIEEYVPYEEVEKYFPKIGKHRPIVLIGPPGVGKSKLKRHLLESNMNHFKTAIPVTTRTKKEDEQDGEKFNFITQLEMDKGIVNKRFIEIWENEGSFYGTTLECIRTVVNGGHVCVICPHPDSLKSLRTSEIRPFVIYIKPAKPESMKTPTLSGGGQKTKTKAKVSTKTSDEEFRLMQQRAERIESCCSHVIDMTIVNEDISTSCKELILACHRVETEPTWVPASWIS